MTQNGALPELRFLIVDDHEVVRRGVQAIIAERFEKSTFSEAGDGQEALELVWSQDWSAVVLDISMPGRSGLEILRELRQSRPRLPIVVLSIHAEDQLAMRVLRLGATSYVCKDSARKELINALEAGLRGGKYIPPTLAERLAFQLDQDHTRAPHETLSDREYQVLCLIASGKTVKEVASELSLSIKTVSTYRSRILEKLGLRNNSQLMRYAVQHNLIAAVV